MEDGRTKPVAGRPAAATPAIPSNGATDAAFVACGCMAPPAHRSAAATRASTSGAAGAPPPRSRRAGAGIDHNGHEVSGRGHDGPRAGASISAHHGRAAPAERRDRRGPPSALEGVSLSLCITPAAAARRIPRSKNLKSQHADLGTKLRASGLSPRQLALRLELQRPLLFPGVATIQTEQCVRVWWTAVLALAPGGDTFLFCETVDPGAPILAGDLADQGIGEALLVSSEGFAAVGERLQKFHPGSDVALLGLTNLAIRQLQVEAYLARVASPIAEERIVDVRGLLSDRECLALEAVLRFYLGKTIHDPPAGGANRPEPPTGPETEGLPTRDGESEPPPGLDGLDPAA